MQYFKTFNEKPGCEPGFMRLPPPNGERAGSGKFASQLGGALSSGAHGALHQSGKIALAKHAQGGGGGAAFGGDAFAQHGGRLRRPRGQLRGASEGAKASWRA